MFPNLRAEMARRSITVADLASVIHKTDRTVSDKLNGRGDFTLSEACAIRDGVFPGQTLEYLFTRESLTESRERK